MDETAGGPEGSGSEAVALRTVPALAGARVLLGVTGGIAAYKAAELARELMRAGAEVQPMLTESGERMVSRATFAALTGRRGPAPGWGDPARGGHAPPAPPGAGPGGAPAPPPT